MDDPVILKQVEHYMSLPYTIMLTPDEVAGWFVKIKELPGCMTQGETREEALEMIDDAMEGWLYVSIESGFEIPLPEDMDYS